MTSPREPQPGQSPYQVLGVSRDATAEEIRKAYRAKAKAHHPDVSGSESNRAFELVKLAYEILRDPVKRRTLDEAPPPGPVSRGRGPHYYWSNIAARPGPSDAGKGGKSRRRGAKQAGESGFEEMYEAFFQTRIDQAAGGNGSCSKGG